MIKNEPLRTMFKDREGHWDSPTMVAFLVGALGACSIVFMTLTETTLALFVRDDHAFHLQELGIGIGAIAGGLGPFLAAYGVYWASDAFNRQRMAAAENKSLLEN